MFTPSADLDRPHVSVSADVVVADDEATARELATGYGLWVRSIRTAEGAIPFPTPEDARRHTWTDADRELVSDRLETQFVGSPAQVADELERLLSFASPLHLYAEEIDPRTGRHLGNFPQAFTHLAMINAVVHVIRAEEESDSAGVFQPANAPM